MKQEWLYRAEVVRVIDGDTVDFILDLGFDIKVKQRIRLLDIDTEELRGGTEESKQRAREAKAFVEEKLNQAEVIYVETFQDARGSFGRYLGIIHITDNTTSFTLNLNETLIKEGFEKQI